MIVTWIAIQCQPLPWAEHRTDVAYVACGEQAGELSLVRTGDSMENPAICRLLDSLEKAVSEKREQAAAPNLDWVRRAIPDQGTSIRLSSVRQCRAISYEDQVTKLSSPVST
jgi:hypothetical protein